MKIKRTVTPEVVAANRANAQKSTSPRQHHHVRLNALTHGILTRKLTFRSDEEKNEFDGLVAGLVAEYPPSGLSEMALVEEAAIALWKMGKLYGWCSQELESRRLATRQVLKRLVKNEPCDAVPFFGGLDDSPPFRPPDWDCDGLVVRAARASSEHEKLDDDKSGTKDAWQVEAKLRPSLELICRYQTAWDRKFYRALNALRQIQRERREAEELAAGIIEAKEGRSDDEKIH